MRKSLITLTFLIPLIRLSGVAAIITVDDDGPAAYSSIQTAIDHSFDGDTIEVQPGTYFERINFCGKAITVTSTEPQNKETVMATIIDGTLSSPGTVVKFDAGETTNTVLAGFTVRGGMPLPDGTFREGHGIQCNGASPHIDYCIVTSNGAKGISGEAAKPKITHCTIRKNLAINVGDGIHNCDGLIADCIIEENYQYGLSGCDGQIDRCVVSANAFGFAHCTGSITGCRIHRNKFGGLAHCYGSLTNCIVTGNLQDGIYGGFQTVVNCTIAGNDKCGYQGTYNSGATFRNCIVVLNGAYGLSGAATMYYNNVWGNLSGSYQDVSSTATDIHENPLFAIDGYWAQGSWMDGDYHLRSAVGRWSGSEWVNDEVTSPCIDAGDPASDIGKELYPNGGRINMGTYGGTMYASKSPHGDGPEPEPECVAPPSKDYNGDCKVDLADLAEFLTEWLICGLDMQEACWK